MAAGATATACASTWRRLRLHQPNYEFLKDAIANDVRDLRAFFAQLDLPVRVSGLPACLDARTRS